MSKFWKLTDRDSAIFTSMKTIAMFMVLVIHADLRNHGAVKSWGSDLYNEFFSLILANSAVPVFFFISGFFLFRNYDFKKKLSSRIHTVFIPFFLWCLWGLAILFVLQIVLGLEFVFSGKELKLLRDFVPIDYIRIFWNIRDGSPVISTLWFLRDLCIMILLSPLVYILISFNNKGGGYFVLLLFICGITKITNPLINWGSLFFFAAGGWVAVKGLNLFETFDRYDILIIICANLCLTATMFAYVQDFYYYNVVLKLWIISSIPLLYLICRNKLIYQSKSLGYLSSMSFFIYLFHEPMMGYMQKIFFKFVFVPIWSQYVLFWLFPLLALVVSVIVFKLLQKITPNFLRIIIGGRS